jgi:nitroreductase
MDAILGRRSIRRFEDRPVPIEMVRDLLRAAMYAPSASNRRPWHFVTVTDRALLEAVPGFHPHAAMVPASAGVIVVCAATSGYSHPMWVQDCSAATQNILLAAHSMGLGSVWLGLHPREDRTGGCRLLLGIPPEMEPFSMIAYGWPAEKPPVPERFEEDRLHWDRW